MFGSFLGIPSSTAVAQLSTCSLYMRSAPALPGFCRYGLIAFRTSVDILLADYKARLSFGFSLSPFVSLLLEPQPAPDALHGATMPF
jgi:hypothetical protein